MINERQEVYSNGHHIPQYVRRSKQHCCYDSLNSKSNVHFIQSLLAFFLSHYFNVSTIKTFKSCNFKLPTTAILLCFFILHPALYYIQILMVSSLFSILMVTKQSWKIPNDVYFTGLVPNSMNWRLRHENRNVPPVKISNLNSTIVKREMELVSND